MLKFRTISQLIQLFVLPELRQRLANGTLDATKLPLELKQFRAIQRRLADGSVSPVIEINDEVRLRIQTRVRRAVTAGTPVALGDIHVDECYIQPPEYDGKPAAYFFCHSLIYDYCMYFDCRPNLEGFDIAELQAAKVPYPISDVIHGLKFKETIEPTNKLRLLSANNWPPAPGYFPATLLALHHDPSIINDARIVAEVTKSYARAYWDERLAFWQETNLFPGRTKYLDRAIRAHFEEDYACSIYVLVPQFEGIIKDYIAECGRGVPPGFVQSVRTLRDLISSRMVVMFPRDILDSIFDYLETGTFWKNTGQISDPSALVNRHGIAHGVFVNFDNQVVSLKYMILLDALATLILHDRMVGGSLVP